MPATAQSNLARCSSGGQVSELSGLDLEALLNTRIITASRFSEQESDAPGIIYVVSRDEMRRFGGTTLRDVLNRVPGLTGTTAYFTDRNMVAARGDQTKIDGGHILLLIKAVRRARSWKAASSAMSSNRFPLTRSITSRSSGGPVRSSMVPTPFPPSST